jgi:hypothetical protein
MLKDALELLGLEMPIPENVDKISSNLETQFKKRCKELHVENDELTRNLLIRARDYFKDMCEMYTASRVKNNNKQTIEILNRVYEKYNDENDKGYQMDDFDDDKDQEYRIKYNANCELEGIDEHEDPFIGNKCALSHMGVATTDLKHAFMGTNSLPEYENRTPPTLQEYMAQREKDDEMFSKTKDFS